MTHVFAKLRMRGNSNKYRKMLSTEEDVYRTPQQIVVESFPYNPGAKLDLGEWFMIPEFSRGRFSIDITSGAWETVDYDSLKKDDYENIDFLFTQTNESLYFQRFETASLIFKSMVRLYRDATDHEVKSFLENSFIVTVDGFEADNVTRSNRKLIAQAVDQFENMKQEDRKKIFSYIQEYCPHLATEGKQFIIKSNKDLKMVLYGIGQRFYTTPVGDEQRIANSTILNK